MVTRIHGTSRSNHERPGNILKGNEKPAENPELYALHCSYLAPASLELCPNGGSDSSCQAPKIPAVTARCGPRPVRSCQNVTGLQAAKLLPAFSIRNRACRGTAWMGMHSQRNLHYHQQQQVWLLDSPIDGITFPWEGLLLSRSIVALALAAVLILTRPGSSLVGKREEAIENGELREEATNLTTSRYRKILSRAKVLLILDLTRTSLTINCRPAELGLLTLLKQDAAMENELLWAVKRLIRICLRLHRMISEVNGLIHRTLYEPWRKERDSTSRLETISSRGRNNVHTILSIYSHFELMGRKWTVLSQSNKSIKERRKMVQTRNSSKRSYAQLFERSSSSEPDVPTPRPRRRAPKRRRVVESDDEYVPDDLDRELLPDADDGNNQPAPDQDPSDNETDDGSVDSEATVRPTVHSRNATVPSQPQPQPPASDNYSTSESSSWNAEEMVLPDIPDPEEELDQDELAYLARWMVRQGYTTPEDAAQSARAWVEQSLEEEKKVMEERRRKMEARADRIMEDVQYGDYSSGTSESASPEEASASQQGDGEACQNPDANLPNAERSDSDDSGAGHNAVLDQSAQDEFPEEVIEWANEVAAEDQRRKEETLAVLDRVLQFRGWSKSCAQALEIFKRPDNWVTLWSEALEMDRIVSAAIHERDIRENFKCENFKLEGSVEEVQTSLGGLSLGPGSPAEGQSQESDDQGLDMSERISRYFKKSASHEIHSSASKIADLLIFGAEKPVEVIFELENSDLLIFGAGKPVEVIFELENLKLIGEEALAGNEGIQSLAERQLEGVRRLGNLVNQEAYDDLHYVAPEDYQAPEDRFQYLPDDDYQMDQWRDAWLRVFADPRCELGMGLAMNARHSVHQRLTL
ncbi:hypothetical protein V8F20_004765 [Naviculisporaceae sp. PSN 640]